MKKATLAEFLSGTKLVHKQSLNISPQSFPNISLDTAKAADGFVTSSSVAWQPCVA